MTNPEDDKWMEQVFETIKANENRASVPAFDELVGKARQQKRTRSVVRMLSWAATLLLIAIPSVWFAVQPAETLEETEIADIYHWEAPSDSWFAALDEEAEDTILQDEDYPTDQLIIQEKDTL